VTALLHNRKYQRSSFRVEPKCSKSKLFYTSPPAFFPFAAQFGDGEILGIEEWRRLPLLSTAAALAEVAGRPAPNPAARQRAQATKSAGVKQTPSTASVLKR